MPNQIDKIKQLLSNGKEYKALKALVDLLKSHKNGNELLNNAFLLQARLEGIESRFNQGITSYEKWEISRNKILKSTLDFVSTVEKKLEIDEHQIELKDTEITESVATNSTFIHRLANPELFRRMSFYYLILWIILGAFDSLVFQVSDASSIKTYSLLFDFSTYVPEEKTVTWLKDFIGHLFAFGTAALSIILVIIKSNLSRTSTLNLNLVNDLYKKYFLLYILVGLGLIAMVIYFNATYVAHHEIVALWSSEISPDFLPALIAINFFALVMIPMMLSVFHYCLLLYITIKKFKNFSSYNPFHGDKSFGLSLVGKSIFWGTLAFVTVMLTALSLQLFLKNGELTFGIFLGTILFVIFVWFGAINPLIKLSRKLKLEKDRLYESVKDEVRTNNRMLGQQSSAEDLNTVKLLLDASRDNEKELLELKILPISRNELLVGGSIVFLLLAAIVFQIH